ncbi:hypothetical protein G5714_002823 [Onychostoma macrolepis]|uniref:Uncharacterized protein n=1 Tax=Onychostoma macrolepis TaxID=369639 RepID=A0A7J6D8W1_9TELE|nr:hypothetical protein G5714_002823 [Onychostoma macrolepis]
MDHLDKDLQATEDQKLVLLSNVYKTIKHLPQIALKPDSAFTLQHLDFFIPRVREAGKEDWVRELEEMKRIAEAEEANKDAVEDDTWPVASTNNPPKKTKEMVQTTAVTAFLEVF